MAAGQSILERLPEVLPREADSIIRRYVEAYDAEIEEGYESEIESIKVSRQVDRASGQDLDRIGKLFGSVGRRRGRDDNSYKRFLKSVVQAFSGRGTDLSMRRALAAALDIDVDDVQIVEDTDNVEYVVVLSDWSAHSTNTIYEIADTVDPSGVDQSNLRYVLPDTEATAADETVGADGQQVVPDNSLSFVVVDVRDNDSLVEETNQSSVLYQDSIIIGGGQGVLLEEAIAQETYNDSAELQTDRFVRWDTTDWDTFNWNEKIIGEKTAVNDLVTVTVQDE